MILDPLEVLKQLVAIPSVNPMGRDVTGPIYGTARLTDFLEKVCRQIGLTTQRQLVVPGHENLIARLDGHREPEDGGVVLLDAHQDTVPVDGMTIPPFEPQEREGRLYGRGACDTKGGMAAILAALSRLAQHQPRPAATVILSCTINEEYGCTGARRLTESWSGGHDKIMPRKPDVAVSVEPTGLEVVIAHRGVIRWKCNTHGRAGHSSRPIAEDNAVYAMARVVTAIEQYAAALGTHGRVHPLCGPCTANVGTIRGGASANIVPDRCTIEIELRPPPGDDLAAARQRLIDHLTHTVAARYAIEHEPPYMAGPPLSDQHNGALAEQLCQVAGEVAGGCRKVGVPYGTNAAMFAAAGVPSVVLGPGFLAQAHTADEWVPVDQVRQVAEILYRFCLAFAQPEMCHAGSG
jgi:acetylornithine deacetylase